MDHVATHATATFFRQVMAHFTTGVTVVTTTHQGSIRGMTVNAFCSVSLHPPLVLICVKRSSSMFPLLHASKIFAVNMLTEQQKELAWGFAASSEEREHFCYAAYHVAVTQAPILDEGLAFVDARVVAEYPGGDHVIFLGEVLAMGAAGQVVAVPGGEELVIPQYGEGDGYPLLYYLGNYHSLNEQKRSLPISIP